MRVAFLGLGRMGSAMAAHVLEAGHELTVWNRTPGKADELVGRGAREASGVGDAVGDADAVVLMLFGPDADRDVMAEVVAAAAKGTLVVDATTVGPEDARELAKQAQAAGLAYVEAPVVGTVGPAQQGTLGVFAGGTAEDVERARPLLELWGDPEKVRHVGAVGSAASLKLVVNLGLGVAIQGVGEAMRLAERLGLDEQVVLSALGAGALGFTVGQKRPMLESHDFSATTFSLELMAKDLQLCLDAGGDLPAAAAALASARRGVEGGHGSDDYARLADVVREGP